MSIEFEASCSWCCPQVVDMPPGTGDIQITLSQVLSLSGAVVVTTPHALSVVDAIKGVSMFQEMQVPTLALVSGLAVAAAISV